jgi:hypothetical protein
MQITFVVVCRAALTFAMRTFADADPEFDPFGVWKLYAV